MKSFSSLGIRSCKRGGLPCAFRKALQSLTSRFRASSESVLRKRKWVTFINLVRFLWSRSLERIEVSLLPIYTTVLDLTYPNSYAPATSGLKSTTSSLKGRHCVASGIPLFYTTLVIDSNTLPCYPLAKRLEDISDDRAREGNNKSGV